MREHPKHTLLMKAEGEQIKDKKEAKIMNKNKAG
jgi:hypothetical protein